MQNWELYETIRIFSSGQLDQHWVIWAWNEMTGEYMLSHRTARTAE